MRMNKQKKEIVPKLRFPEFSQSCWGITRLHALADKITERNKDDHISRVFTNSAAEGVVDQEEYFDRDIANKNNLTNYFIVERGDYVYNPRISATAPVGPVSKNKLGIGVMSPLYTVFRFRNKENDFYEHFFLTNLWHAYIKGLSNTGARHDRITISADNFMKMPLPYTSPEEQQKIADCLSSIDELIDGESRKQKAFEQYKKGLMQKLFPAEGKTLPEWRFPEFQGCGEWKISTVEDSFETIAPPKKIVKSEYNDSGKYPIVDQSQEYIAGWTDDETAIVEYRRPLIIFGDHTCVLKFMSQPFAQGADGIKILLAHHKLHEKFAYYCLENIPLNSSGYQRHFSALKEFSIKFPDKNSGEQQKIADCLSEIDLLIKQQAKKVEQLKAHKKGLMQGLFPSLEEADV